MSIAANADDAALHFVEAQQQTGNGGFASAGVADHRDGFAGLDAEADVAQHPVLIFIGEPDVVEFDGGDRRAGKPRAERAIESGTAYPEV